MNNKKCARVIISGIVQGVAYRYNTKLAAARFNIKGWVRNLDSGNVEGFFSGNCDDIDEMISWCRKGPAMAKVSHIDVQWVESTEDFSDFDIRF